MARPPISTNQKVRNLIEKGMTTKQIVKALHVSPQVVYNTRHRLNRNKGIGALPVTGLKSAQAQPIRMQAPVKKSLWQRVVSMFAWH
jgi:DNA invertase Pin-like site-specific DNA recombinase